MLHTSPVRKQATPTGQARKLQLLNVPQGIAMLYCLAGCLTPAVASDNTNTNNRYQWVFNATTNYPGGHSKFVDRTILPGGTGMSFNDLLFACIATPVSYNLRSVPDRNSFPARNSDVICSAPGVKCVYNVSVVQCRYVQLLSDSNRHCTS